jgi:hypothetical protein
VTNQQASPSTSAALRDVDEAIEDRLVRKYKALAGPSRSPRVYPSAQATVEGRLYMAALEAIAGVPSVFCDGLIILLPESEQDAIELQRSKFGASIEYGHGHPDSNDW